MWDPTGDPRCAYPTSKLNVTSSKKPSRVQTLRIKANCGRQQVEAVQSELGLAPPAPVLPTLCSNTVVRGLASTCWHLLRRGRTRWKVLSWGEPKQELGVGHGRGKVPNSSGSPRRQKSTANLPGLLSPVGRGRPPASPAS